MVVGLFLAGIVGLIGGFIEVSLITKRTTSIGKRTGYYSYMRLVSLHLILKLSFLTLLLTQTNFNIDTQYLFDIFRELAMIVFLAISLIPLVANWFIVLFIDFKGRHLIKLVAFFSFLFIAVLFLRKAYYLSTALFILFFAALQYYHYKHYH